MKTPLDSNISAQSSNNSIWVTAVELAQILKIPVGSVRNLTSQGKLPSYKIGRRVRYDLLEIQKIIKFGGMDLTFVNPKLGYKHDRKHKNTYKKGTSNGYSKGSKNRTLDGFSFDEAARRWKSYLNAKDRN